MGKHSIETYEQQIPDKIEKLNKENTFYAQTIARQGKRLIFLENKVKQLETQLTQERTDHIEDLKDINFLATSNSYNNEKIFLHKIAEVTKNKLENLIDGIINPKLKELNSTDQSNK